MFGCPLYVGDVWMSTVHTQHKESMLCQTKGMSICPHTFGCLHMFRHHPYGWMTPVCLDTYHMFGCPNCMFGYVWMSYAWMAPLCLDTPSCLDTLLCNWMPPYVWMMFGCPLYIHNTKKACFVRPRGCLYDTHIFGFPPVCLDAPIHLDTPHIFGNCPVYLDAPIYLDASICLHAHLYVWMSPYV